MIIQIEQYKNVITISAFAAYILAPILNVLIWVIVRKNWHKKYRRWARHKKKQEYVDDSYDDMDERM